MLAKICNDIRNVYVIQDIPNPRDGFCSHVLDWNRILLNQNIYVYLSDASK